MADNTSIPIIVQGNSFSLAIPLQIYVIDDNEMVLEDYTPDPTDEVTIQLKGSRRNYTYTPTIEGNIANIDLGGYELADNYAVVVTIVKQDGKRLRSARTDQFFIVESSDDLTQDDIIAGLEENVIYLNAQAFIAGADGRGIEGIQKTGTSGLVDTYTIYYTDNTTSTFQVTNGANGQAGAQGVGITSIEKTDTQGLVDTYTITLSNGQTSTFEVTNGQDGHDLGLASIINNLNSDSTEDALSAAMGKELGEQIFSHDVEAVNVSASILCGKYIGTGNKWTTPTAGKYQGKIFNISNYKGWEFKIGNKTLSSGNYFYRFALLKTDNHTTTNAVADFSATAPFTALISVNSADASAQWYEGVVPEDVNYIYIYTHNTDNPEGYKDFDPELYFTDPNAESVLDELKAVQGSTSVYDMLANDCQAKQTIGNDGTTYTGNNAPYVRCFPKSASQSVAVATTGDCYVASELPSKDVTLTFDALGSGYWSIAIAEYDNTLSFIQRQGYTRANADNDWKVSFRLSVSTAFFKVMVAKYNADGTGIDASTYTLTDGFCSFIKGTATHDSLINRVSALEQALFKFTFCSWNIGHFSLGKSYDTFISDQKADLDYSNYGNSTPYSNYDAQLTRWRQCLNEYSPDILMTCEYCATFAHNSGGDVNAVDAIFNKWLYNRIGSLPSATSYMRTAVFSNAVLGGAYEVVYPQTVQAGRYYQCVDTIIGGVPTKLVVTHLDFGATGDGATYRAAQIQKLITDFANKTHVIICGDFNVSSADEYDAFVNAGYTMANHGYMGNVLTYPSSGTEVWGTGGTKTMYNEPVSPLDNIVVKGFAMGNIRLIDKKELSDHCGVVCDLTLI